MKEQEVIKRLNFHKEYARLSSNRVVISETDIETVLNMLKEKDKEIEELKQALARNIAKNFTSSMKKSVKSKEDLEMLNAGWQIEIEKKDKIIDLMSEQIKIPEPTMKIESFDIKSKTKFGMRYLNKEEVKQYFERKIRE